MYGGPREPCLPEERNAGRSTGEPDAPFIDGGPNVRPHPRMGDPATDRGPTGDRRGTSPFAAVTFKINAGAGFSNRVFWARQMDLGPWRRRADGASPDGSRKLSRHFPSPPRSTRRGLSPTWVDLVPESGPREGARSPWLVRTPNPPALGRNATTPGGAGRTVTMSIGWGWRVAGSTGFVRSARMGPRPHRPVSAETARTPRGPAGRPWPSPRASRRRRPATGSSDRSRG